MLEIQVGSFPVEVGYWLELETFQSQGAFWLDKMDAVTKGQVLQSARWVALTLVKSLTERYLFVHPYWS